MANREPWTQRLRGKFAHPGGDEKKSIKGLLIILDHCLIRQLGEPAYQDVSDRRGGRTAWSTVAIVNGIPYSARFWYDGAYMELAKQDAAEIALRKITGYTNLGVEPPPASHYQNPPTA